MYICKAKDISAPKTEIVKIFFSISCGFVTIFVFQFNNHIYQIYKLNAMKNIINLQKNILNGIQLKRLAI